MHRVQPEVYLVGESAIDEREVERFLRETYAEVGTGWFDKNIDIPGPRPSDSELLTEVMGRLCYRSFGVGEHNKNLTKIREGNAEYIENILKSRHGSVIEHGSTSWILKDVSRVFTHELVRHRAGVAVSQESLRYVRMDDFGLWIPKDPELTPEIVAMCEAKFAADEFFCRRLTDALGLDDPGRDFGYKKKWTSFIRRFAPQGMSTTIGITINFRAIRHVLEMRTAEGAEVEIRHVFDKIAFIAKRRWPALLQDFAKNERGEWQPRNSKV
jgi:thymidylate synthase (FAD)